MALFTTTKSVTEDEALEQEVTEVKPEEVKEIAVISSTTKIDGNITTQGHLVLSGTVTGNVSAKGNLVLAGVTSGEVCCENLIVETENAESDIIADNNVIVKEGTTVRGNVNCVNVTVFGRVLGDVTARGTVVLKATAAVEGNISAKSICMEDGAKLNGNVFVQ